MVGCFNISLVEFKLNRLRAYYKSQGLQSKLIELSDGTTMHCWVPRDNLPTDRRMTSQKVHNAATIVDNSRSQKPALLLIHGFMGNGMLNWENQVASFGKHYSLYIPDLLFFGESTTVSLQRSESFQAECMAKMLQELGVSAVTVLGTSYGGMVAFRMAHLFPSLVTRVIFCSTGVCMVPSSNDEVLELCGASDITEVLLPVTEKGLRTTLNLGSYKPHHLPGFLCRDILKVLYEDMREERIELLQALIIGTDLARPLPTITQEALLVWGEHDRIFNLDLAQQLQQHVGVERAQLVLIKEAGHVPHLEKPKEFNHAVLQFLKSSSTSHV